MFIGGGISNGIILQRFPEKDWSDTPFIEGIEWVRFFFNYIFTSYITFLKLIFFLCSFVNHKDGPYLQKDKNHDFLYLF